MFSNKIKKNSLLILLIFLTIFTRFYSLDWGNGVFFNPDENNMAIAVSQLSRTNLNPNFFAYGQFPLFLTFFTTPVHNFSTIVLTLRFWSALFSSLSLLFFYLIAKNIFKSNKIGLIFVLLLIFTPGLIQSAHFGTTESLLILVLAVNIFLSLKYYQTSNNNYFLFSVLISAIGIGSKITAVFFVLSFYLCFFLLFIKDKNVSKLLSTTFIFTLLVLLLSLLFSPFSLIDFSDFKASMIYETSVAVGKTKVFYTRQFENSLPYLYQFKKIFPYSNGIFIFICSFIGFIFFLKTKIKKEILLIFVPSLLYFIYSGQLFVKWSRFMSPLFFIGPFLCLYIFKHCQNKMVTFILLLIMISPGLYFFKNYFFLDTRIIASDWINSNLPLNSFVLSESGNVVDLPIYSSGVTIDNFNFYQLDEDKAALPQLIKNLSDADYIFIPSRRVFMNQNNNNYPLSQKYYQNLFSGDLGFIEIKTVSRQKDLFLNSQNAEETWSVFDNPTVRIFKKNTNLKPEDYEKLFTSN